MEVRENLEHHSDLGRAKCDTERLQNSQGMWAQRTTPGSLGLSLPAAPQLNLPEMLQNSLFIPSHVWLGQNQTNSGARARTQSLGPQGLFSHCCLPSSPRTARSSASLVPSRRCHLGLLHDTAALWSAAQPKLLSSSICLRSPASGHQPHWEWICPNLSLLPRKYYPGLLDYGGLYSSVYFILFTFSLDCF